MTLENIGPFQNVSISFPSKRDIKGRVPVTIITGENGSGKSIILDAIRSIFLGPKAIERDITASNNFLINCVFEHNNEIINIQSKSKAEAYLGTGIDTNRHDINFMYTGIIKPDNIPDWVTMYWSSNIPKGSYRIENLVSPEPEKYLVDSLSADQASAEITETICYFDYLKSSDDEKEKHLGEILFSAIKKIIRNSLNNGELKYVSRKTMSPIIVQNGQELTLDKLSAGNLLLIQRMVLLMSKMYAVHILNNKPTSELFNTQGILLIDEPENHLHPKWQKTLLESVQELFPYLQIILTTHSPFIVASVKNSTIFVCHTSEGQTYVLDETDEYSNSPVDEILLTPVFNTQPFGPEISRLIIDRKIAIKENNFIKKNEIESKLMALNPEQFAFINIEEKLSNL